MIPLYTPEEFNHARSADLLLFECKCCHSPFTRQKKWVLFATKNNKPGPQYCSHKCSIKAKHDAILKVPCGYCGSILLVNTHRLSNTKSGLCFCDTSCAAKYNNTHRVLPVRTKPVNNTPRQQPRLIEQTCIICGNIFNHPRRKKTCSKPCHTKLNKQCASKGGNTMAFNRKHTDSDKTTYIYALLDQFNQIRYIGKADNINRRYKTHIIESKHCRTHKEKWIYSMIQNDIKPDIIILDECKLSNWIYLEEYWISQCKSWGFNLTNGTTGGEGSNGFKGKTHSESTKQKLREYAINKYKSKNVLHKVGN